MRAYYYLPLAGFCASIRRLHLATPVTMGIGLVKVPYGNARAIYNPNNVLL